MSFTDGNHKGKSTEATGKKAEDRNPKKTPIKPTSGPKPAQKTNLNKSAMQKSRKKLGSLVSNPHPSPSKNTKPSGLTPPPPQKPKNDIILRNKLQCKQPKKKAQASAINIYGYQTTTSPLAPAPPPPSAPNYNSNITYRTSIGGHQKTLSNISNLNPNLIGLPKSPYKGSEGQIGQNLKVSPSHTGNLTLAIGGDEGVGLGVGVGVGVGRVLGFGTGNNSFNNSFVKDR